MFGRFLLAAAIGGTALSISACEGPASRNGEGGANEETATAIGSETPIGKSLYPVVKVASPTQDTQVPGGKAGIDPIVIPECRLSVIEREEAPAMRDGVLLFIGTEIKPGEQVPPERLIRVKMANEERQYRKLLTDDRVEPGQLLAIVDNRLALADVAIKGGKITVSQAEKDAADKTVREAQARYETQVRLRKTGATSEEDVRGAKLTWDKTVYDAISKRESVELARLELNQSKIVADMHEIRTKIGGVIKHIYKQPNESIKSLDPVFTIRNHDRLRVEGLVDVQQYGRLHKGMKVIIEPYDPQSPQETLIGHDQEITSVAVSKDNGAIVSASEDGTVRVWDRIARHERRILSHLPNSPVRALACTPAGADKNLCVTGTADGTVRIWDLNGNDAKPLHEVKGKHRSVTAVAISLDGKSFATAGADAQISVWDMDSCEVRYAFKGAHGSITSLQFTPQSTLVSAARDNTLRLWNVGDQGARLVKSFDRRAGDVGQLGVSPDGRKVLFDQGKTLRLRSLPQGLTLGLLQNPMSAANFTTLALFSPDGNLVLTTGATEGRMQLWVAPNEVNRRGHEVKQLATAERSVITCAAFAPDGTFVLTGGRDRQVMIWKMPTKEELDRPLVAELTLVEPAVESSGGQVRVWAEFPNPDGRFLPGSTATIVVNPTE